MEKKFKISQTRSNSDKETIIEGTFNELLEKFSTTLVAGNLANPKIKRDPKNMNEFMTALQKSFNVLEKSERNQTFVDLVK